MWSEFKSHETKRHEIFWCQLFLGGTVGVTSPNEIKKLLQDGLRASRCTACVRSKPVAWAEEIPESLCKLLRLWWANTDVGWYFQRAAQFRTVQRETTVAPRRQPLAPKHIQGQFINNRRKKTNHIVLDERFQMTEFIGDIDVWIFTKQGGSNQDKELNKWSKWPVNAAASWNQSFPHFTENGAVLPAVTLLFESILIHRNHANTAKSHKRTNLSMRRPQQYRSRLHVGEGTVRLSKEVCEVRWLVAKTFWVTDIFWASSHHATTTTTIVSRHVPPCRKLLTSRLLRVTGVVSPSHHCHTITLTQLSHNLPHH